MRKSKANATKLALQSWRGREIERRRSATPAEWGISDEQLALASSADVQRTRRALKRCDAFDSLYERGGLTRHQHQAAERLVSDLAELYGVAGDAGRTAMDRDRGLMSPAATLSTERKFMARARVRNALGQLGPVDRRLLLILAEQIVLAVERHPWRDVVRDATGEKHQLAQASLVRLACENLRVAYGIGPAPERVHPFEALLAAANDDAGAEGEKNVA